MKTVSQVSSLTGVSVRTLHHYDAIGLLKPTAISPAGYRLYDGRALARLQQILLFRELEFPLREIQAILDSPNYTLSQALEQQIDLLTLKKERLERLIALAQDIKLTGGKHMDFTAFDTAKQKEYAAQAKALYGHTPEYQESQEREAGRSPEETQALSSQMMEIFAGLGRLQKLGPQAGEVQAQIQRLQDFITAHFYTCSEQTLAGLGLMYASGGELGENIDKAGGPGTAAFAGEAIAIYCGKATKDGNI